MLQVTSITMAPKTLSSTADNSKEKGPVSHHPSVNVISFCIFLVGIGTLFGYSTFYVTFQTACSHLLLDQTERHNASHAQLQTKYSRALDDVRQCQDDAQTKGELQELQGRLQAQAALSNKHQDLLERHEKALERISVLQQSNERSQEQIQTLKEGIKIVKVSLEESILQRQEAERDCHDTRHQLQGQIDHTNQLLQERSQENTQRRNELDSCEHHSQDSMGKLDELKNLVQQQNFAQVIAKYVSCCLFLFVEKTLSLHLLFLQYTCFSCCVSLASLTWFYFFIGTAKVPISSASTSSFPPTPAHRISLKSK